MFSVSFSFTLVRLYLRMCSFYWHLVVSTSLLRSLYFCGVSCNFFFISNFIDLGHLHFLLICLAYQVYSFKEPTHYFHWFFFLLYFNAYFISALIFMTFPSTNFDFVCSSLPSSFRCKLRFFIWDLFPEVFLYQHKLPS